MSRNTYCTPVANGATMLSHSLWNLNCVDCSYRASPYCDRRRRCGGLFAPHGRGRKRHSPGVERPSQGVDRSAHCRAQRTHRQDHGRRPPADVPVDRRGSLLRRGDAERNGKAQPGHPGRQPYRIPDRRPYRRRDRRQGRRVRRRRQYCGAARADRAAGRHLPVRGCVPAGAGQARYCHRRRRRAEPEEHFESHQGLSHRAVGGGYLRCANAARRAETAMVGAGSSGGGDDGSPSSWRRSHGSLCSATGPMSRGAPRRQSRSPSARCRSSPCCPSPIKPATTARIISPTV